MVVLFCNQNEPCGQSFYSSAVQNSVLFLKLFNHSCSSSAMIIFSNLHFSTDHIYCGLNRKDNPIRNMTLKQVKRVRI